MSELSFEVAKNCMDVVKRGAVTDAFEALGISNDDFMMVAGDLPWIASDRGRVVAVLNLLTHGVVDVLGLPRIEVPGEFRAAVLATFVSPCNLAVACRWCEAGTTAEEASAGGSLEPVTARQLFAMCLRIAPSAIAGKAAWEKRTGRAIKDVTGRPNPVPLEDFEDGERQTA